MKKIKALRRGRQGDPVTNSRVLVTRVKSAAPVPVGVRVHVYDLLVVITSDVPYRLVSKILVRCLCYAMKV